MKAASLFGQPASLYHKGAGSDQNQQEEVLTSSRMDFVLRQFRWFVFPFASVRLDLYVVL